MIEKIKVKVETFERAGRGWGARICFLYEDRGPEIFEKDGFPADAVAFAWAKQLVQDTAKSIPQATLKEDAPCS